MPITNGRYVNPVWINNSSPAINSRELNDISDTLEKLDKTNFVPQLLVDATVDGAVVTVTNGKTTLTQTYNGNTLVFEVDSFGIWTATLTQGSQTSRNITVDVTEVKQYPITLSFFSASIIVTYPQGSTLTATNGTNVLTATDTSGKFTFVVPSAGTWTITSTDGDDSSSVEVLISTEGQAKSIIISDYKIVASTSALSGVTYETGMFSDYRWDYSLLNDISRAISDNSSITNRTTMVYIDRGAEHYKLSVGDMVVANVGGEYDTKLYIMGFNHDILSTSTAYGKKTATEMAGITLGMVNCLSTKYSMNGDSETAVGWINCELRDTLQNNLINKDPQLKNIIKTVDKYYFTSLSMVAEDTFFIPSTSEIFGTANADDEGEQYAYYLAGNTILKTVRGTLSDWALRTRQNGQMYDFVSADGELGGTTAYTENGISVMFCV